DDGCYVVVKLCSGFSIEGRGEPVEIRDAVLGAEIDARHAFRAPLGGNKYHAVGTAYPVHGRGGGVFQYRDAFDIVGFDLREIAFHPIDQHEGGGAMERGPAAGKKGGSVSARAARPAPGSPPASAPREGGGGPGHRRAL